MSGYRRVNYYELCRLCTSSEGTKMHIFREEGKRRQLPTKIKQCLPLQVSEEDSLPKIICSLCVDKLESFNEFRTSCVNAEAMLEGYFTSLRYSEDFIREGKVYVKDESPPKKKNPNEIEKPTIKVPQVQTVQTVQTPVSVDGLNNLVQTASIQIVSQPEAEVNRQPQYKCTLEMQPTIVSQAVVQSPTVRYSYQTCTNMAATNTTTNVTLLKTEDSTQTDYQKEMNKSELNQSHQNHQPMDQGTTTYYVRIPNSVEQGGSANQIEDSEVVGGETLHHQAITFTPSDGQDMLVHFGYNKDNKDQNNSTTVLRTDDRASIAQIGEFLRMKTVEEEEDPLQTNEEEFPLCDHCGKELNTPELQENHSLTCTAEDKKGGFFSCEVCGKPFKRKEHLFQHRKLHTGERPYACGTCGKAFSRKEHLVRHSVSHTGQKVHSCDMCNKSFSRKDNLHKHRKTHGIAGPYVCEMCGKSFVVKHYYLMHKTTHSSPDTPDEPLPYRCDVCYKGFSVKQYLTTHKLRHRGKTTNLDADSTSCEQTETDTENQDSIELSTVNAAAILPPNVIHHGNNTPLFQVTTGTNTTYLTTAATNQLIGNIQDNYRSLHRS